MQKDAYFTSETIQRNALEMIGAVEELRVRHRSIVFQSDVATLLVLDMQKYFLADSGHAFIPSAPAIVTGVQKLVGAFSSIERPIIFTRHVNSPEDAGKMNVWWKDIIHSGSDEAEIIRELETSKGTVITKHQYDAFFETPLEDLLNNTETEQVLISGVMTHLCCESTARSAFIRDYDVFFAVDGTATYNRAFHESTLMNLAHGFALPVLVEEILKEIKQNAS